MNRLDRALAILLLLRSGKTRSATDLARHFEVSRRTIYRDIETLNAVGVPVYAEIGRAGGFRLLAGYFLPPVMFTSGEAISLLVGLTLLRSLHAVPFAVEVATAEQKLLAAVPEHLRTVLMEARAIIGFERPPDNLFHPEPLTPGNVKLAITTASVGATVTVFLQAVLGRRTLLLDYHSPYGGRTDQLVIIPLGVFWDRDRWYLAGRRIDDNTRTRFWRADRVGAIVPHLLTAETRAPFDIRDFMGRTWLREAMDKWHAESPVTIRLTRAQATQLQRDWYYRHAHYENDGDDAVRMRFGEDDQETVFALLRWLGPSAELMEPSLWRTTLREQLIAMLALYHED